ncbi:MAG TPA: zf-HC2 domain-containing protein [Candidatus Binatia bacterium]|nr:zf-HC2 domain-containing protein [Candidatus Binatia bacterium]
MDQNRITLENACADFEADLVLYYYGDGSVVERRRVEAHLMTCERCGRFLDDLRGLLPQMATKAELPANFWNDYYREMVRKLEQARERKSWWRDLVPNFGGWAVPAFGTAMVVMLAVTLLFGDGEWNSAFKQANQPPQEMIPQEILSDSSRLEFFKSLDMLESLNVLEKMDGVRAESEIHNV